MKNKICLLAILIICILGTAVAQTPIVGPLIQTQWGWGAPYDSFVPMIGSRRAAVGCAAVSLAQIMNYHRFPARGIGQRESYTTSAGIIVPAVAFNVYYDYDNMLNAYPNASSGTQRQRDAVATLIYHAGLALRMNYQLDGSGPFTFHAREIVDYFGYDRSIQFLARSYFNTDAQWDALIREQLDAGLPVMYSTANPSGVTHSVIIDGYDNTGRFHVNYGYKGQGDGWYFLTDMYQSLNLNHTMRINLKPDQGGVNSGILALTALTADKNSVPQNEEFKVTVSLRGVDIFPGGHVGAALVDNNGRIAAITGIRNIGEINPGHTVSSTEIFCYVPESVSPGRYSLRIVTRPADAGIHAAEEWRIVTLSAVREGVPSSIPFTVTRLQSITPGGGYGIVLEQFESQNSAVRGDSFTVTVRPRNRSGEAFNGQLGVALVDNSIQGIDGRIVAVIGSGNIGLGNNAMVNSQRICTIPNTVAPGRYRLMIVTRPGNNNDNNEWRLATTAVDGISTSIDFTVR